MKALVTGGFGFLGSHIVDLLVDNEVETYVLRSGFRSYKHPDLVNKNARVIQGNLLNPEVLNVATESIDVVFHCGSVLSHYAEAYPELAFDVNVKGTWNLKKACKQNKVKRIVFASTSFVYGDSEITPINENAQLNPKGNFEVGKLSAEKILQATHPFQVPYTILRLFNMYGPRSYPDELYSQVITTYILTALKQESLEIHDDGTQELDFVYVKDVARAFCDCLSEKAENKIFNVGSGKSTSINKLASTINMLTNNLTPSHYNPNHPAYLKRVQADVRSIKECIGWTPKYELKEGLKETISFFNEDRQYAQKEN